MENKETCKYDKMPQFVDFLKFRLDFLALHCLQISVKSRKWRSNMHGEKRLTLQASMCTRFKLL